MWSATTAKLPAQDEALAEEVVANHFLLGEEIKLAELKKDQKRRTAGGQQLVFKVDKNGELEHSIMTFTGFLGNCLEIHPPTTVDVINGRPLEQYPYQFSSF